jgi:hypothetical protein
LSKDCVPVSPHAFQNLRRNVVSLLDLPVEEYDSPVGEEHIEDPDLLAPELKEPFSQDARLGPPERVALLLDEPDEGKRLVPVASRESGDEDLDESLASLRPEDIDDSGAGRHPLLQSPRDNNLRVIGCPAASSSAVGVQRELPGAVGAQWELLGAMARRD